MPEASTLSTELNGQNEYREKAFRNNIDRRSPRKLDIFPLFRTLPYTHTPYIAFELELSQLMLELMQHVGAWRLLRGAGSLRV